MDFAFVRQVGLRKLERASRYDSQPLLWPGMLPHPLFARIAVLFAATGTGFAEHALNVSLFVGQAREHLRLLLQSCFSRRLLLVGFLNGVLSVVLAEDTF